MSQDTFSVKGRTAEELLNEVLSHLSDKARGLWLYLEKERREKGISGLGSLLTSDLDELKQKVVTELDMARKELAT